MRPRGTRPRGALWILDFLEGSPGVHPPGSPLLHYTRSCNPSSNQMISSAVNRAASPGVTPV